MERWQRNLIVVLAALVGALGIFSIGFALGGDRDVSIVVGGSSGADGSRVVQEAFDRILSTAVDPPKPDALARGAVKGMIDVLKKKAGDDYALFFSPRGYRSFQELTTGKFSGIGVWLKSKDGSLQVISVLPDTPALDSGLRRGDSIVSIGDRPVGELTSDEAVALIKGPAGTKVKLGIMRDGSRLSFEITRAEIDLPSLQARLTDDDLGYVRLISFSRRAGTQVRDEVEKLIDKGANGIILDLRDNGGGLFTEAISVASVFIENGTVVTYRDASEGDIDYDAEGDAFADIPLVVLVNEGTASASEIVAGALQDRDRAVLIGTKTYGKGSVQEVLPLPDASAVKFTTAAYLTPDGKNINGEGIEPDVKLDAAPDRQFDRAVEILNGLVLSTSGGQG